MAAKMREPWEMRYFTEKVEPLLGPDAVYLGEVSHERKLELLAGAVGPALPHPLERALRHGDDRGHGLRHAGAGLPRGRGPRGGRPRDHRVPLRRRGRHGRGPRPARRARAGGLPAGGRGLLLHPPHGGRAPRAVRVDARPEPAGRRRAAPARSGQSPFVAEEQPAEHQRPAPPGRPPRPTPHTRPAMEVEHREGQPHHHHARPTTSATVESVDRPDPGRCLCHPASAYARGSRRRRRHDATVRRCPCGSDARSCSTAPSSAATPSAGPTPRRPTTG